MKNFSIFFSIILLFTVICGSQGAAANSSDMYLVALGDSITFGSGDSSKKGYIDRLKILFEERYRIPLKVSNYGVPRYTSENLLEKLQNNEIISEIRNADYIVLYIGTNDFRKSVQHQWEFFDPKKAAEGKTKFSVNLHKLLLQIRNENPEAPIFVLGLYHPYSQYEKSHEILTSICEWNQEIQNTTRQFENAIFVPTIDLFLNKPKKKYFSDSLHPNSRGHQLISERLFEVIRVP